MKTLINKTIKVAGNETNYKELIESALNQTPQGGFSFEEIRKRNKIQDVLDKANGKMSFEDAEAENLKEIVNASRWIVRDKSIEEFGEEVNNL